MDNLLKFKSLFFIFLAAIALFFANQIDFLGKNSSYYSVTQTGIGKFRIKPDLVKISLGWYGKGLTSKEALDKQKEILNNILKETGRLGINSSDLIIAYPSLSYGSDGFQAVNAMTVTLRDVSKINDLVSSLYQTGAVSVTNFVYSTNNPQLAEKQAVELAIKDAREKAKNTAKATGKKLGKIMSVSVTNQEETGTTTVALSSTSHPGEKIENVEISRLVTVVFELK